jgi:hypothetical protein
MFIFTVFFLHSISRCNCIIIIIYSIMPKCDCSQCSRRSAAKCNSHREEKCSRKRKPSSGECNKRKPITCECNKCKPRACECNKCKPYVKPICKCEDSDNDSDSAADCNSLSHQFIITVKTTN